MIRAYASVRILDAAYCADRSYDYYVPDELSGQVTAGCLVSVPFGRGNRRMRGVVTELHGASPLQEVKPIVSVVDPEPLLTEEMLGICRFLVGYTLCTYGEAVRAVVPGAALSKMQEYYRIADAAPTANPEEFSAIAENICTYIQGRKEVSAQLLNTKFGAEGAAVAAALCRSGVLTKERRIRTEKNERFDAYVSPVPEKEAGKLRSPLQMQILALLGETGRINVEELFDRIGSRARPQLASLEKKGLVHIERLEHFRNPYADAATEGEAEASPLSPQQSAAYETLRALYGKGAAAALLHGVTGSGKTRVIKEMIDRVLSDGRGVIVMVPEISLTPQVVEYFCRCYGDRVAVIHSRLSAGERYDAWRRIRRGMADVVIGTRSAVFAPIKNLGMIVIDEEQEHTYKSDTSPKYLAHDVARYRCGRHGALLLLSSATPSLATYHKAVTGVYTLVEMTERYGNAKLPQVEICDMRTETGAGNVSPLSGGLIRRLRQVQETNAQAIVFLNRRGYNSAVSCRVCGQSLECPNCSVSLTYHTRAPIGEAADAEDYFRRRSERGDLACHYCGYRTKVPTTCPTCGAEHFRFTGCGTQQAEEEIERQVPGMRVLRMDMDTTGAKMSHREMIDRFRRGEAQVLLGTQMVTKGHDFPKVTLVGILNADGSLYLDDYRAAERTFSMLTQAIGRAGRAEDPGVAVIQTTNPDSEVIRLAAAQDYKTFYQKEIALRQALVFPPFCDIAVLTLQSSDEALLTASAKRMGEKIRELLQGAFRDVEAVLFGPFETPVYRVQNVCRMRLVLKCRLNKRSRQMFSTLLFDFGKGSTKNLTVSVDFNPSGLSRSNRYGNQKYCKRRRSGAAGQMPRGGGDHPPHPHPVGRHASDAAGSGRRWACSPSGWGAPADRAGG